jgi:hypothetical protein
MLPAAGARREPPPAAAPAKAPGVTATVIRQADGTRTELAWDGPLLSWAVPKDAQGKRTLYVLAGPARDPKRDTSCGVDRDAGSTASDASLYRWRQDDGERLELLASGLPHGGLEAADLDGDGAEELVLVRDGAIDELKPAGATGAITAVTIVHDPAIAAAFGDPRAARSAIEARDTSLRIALPGEFRSYGRLPSGAYALRSALALPMKIIPSNGRVAVETPDVNDLGAVAGIGLTFATDPEPIGALRVRTTLTTPDASPRRDPIECWARLPAPERVLDNTFAIMDGTPVWIATTMSAERLDVFGEKLLRIYPLAGDRTRVGVLPRATATTGLNIWQTGFPVVLDLDRDGHDDLAISYWKGLRRSIAAVEVYPGESSGQLGKRREIEFTVDDADEGWLSFGRDADGDGHPDLIVLTGTSVLVYPGSAERVIERAVVERVSRRIELAPGRPHANSVNVAFELGGGVTIARGDPGFGTPRPIDLDGDGQVELVFAGNVSGTGRATVIAFRKAGGG